jgi:heptosyltransferase-2
MTEKILIIGPSWVGDMVMAQSLFRLIKQQAPSAVIDVLAPTWTFSLLARMPEVSEAIAMPIAHGQLKLKQRYQLAKSLRTRGYTQAIVLPNSFKSALIPWLAGIPRRTGWLGECRYVLLNDYRKLDTQCYPLMVQQYLALGLPAGAALPADYPLPKFRISTEAQQAVLVKHKPLWRGKPVLAICGGAEFGPSKRWPEEYFAEVATKKIEAGWDVWLFGSPKDRPVTEKINALTGDRCENISGRTELAETLDLLSLVSGVVTNDSGLMHVACAMEKPVIAIYGSTSPAFTPPLAQTAQVLKLELNCQPCFKRECPLKHHRCMRDVLPGRVLAAMTGWGV